MRLGTEARPAAEVAVERSQVLYACEGVRAYSARWCPDGTGHWSEADLSLILRVVTLVEAAGRPRIPTQPLRELLTAATSVRVDAELLDRVRKGCNRPLPASLSELERLDTTKGGRKLALLVGAVVWMWNGADASVVTTIGQALGFQACTVAVFLTKAGGCAPPFEPATSELPTRRDLPVLSPHPDK